MSGVFEVEVPGRVSCCGNELPTVEVFIPPEPLRDVIEALYHSKKNEFFAYGVTESRDNGHTFIVDRFIFPEQEVSGQRAKPIEFPHEECKKIHEESGGRLDIELALHSHHDMTISYSPKDKECVNSNNKVSVLISFHGIEAVVWAETVCGSSVQVPADVFLCHPDDKDNMAGLQNVFTENMVPLVVGKKKSKGKVEEFDYNDDWWERGRQEQWKAVRGAGCGFQPTVVEKTPRPWDGKPASIGPAECVEVKYKKKTYQCEGHTWWEQGRGGSLSLVCAASCGSQKKQDAMVKELVKAAKNHGKIERKYRLFRDRS